MSENNASDSQANKADDFKDAAKAEALSAAEKGLEAAQQALAAAERKLAEVKGSCQEQSAKDASSASATEGASSVSSTSSSGGASSGSSASSAGSASEGGFECGPERPFGTQGQGVSSSCQSASAEPNASVASESQQQVAGDSQGASQGAWQANSQGTWQNGAQAQGWSAPNQSQPFSQGWTAPNQNQQYQPPVSPHYSAPYASPKDHVAAGLLAIFLGAFGVHKFYLGYNTQGFIMLAISILAGLFTIGLAVGVIWVIAVVEGILYLTKSQSEFERVYVYGKREWF